MSNAVVPLPGDASEPTVHGPWLLGFHGAVQPARFAGDPPSFLRTLVLSRRSLGTQRMSTLCGLPSARTGMPVSYTHLDVYKRQGVDLSPNVFLHVAARLPSLSLIHI